MKNTTASGFTPELGQRIARAIERAGGVIAVGRALEVSKDTPARWRDGESKISLHHIARLAEISGTDPAWLAFGQDAPGGAEIGDFDLVEEAAETVIEIAVSLDKAIDPARLAHTIRLRAQRLVQERNTDLAEALTRNRKRG